MTTSHFALPLLLACFACNKTPAPAPTVTASATFAAAPPPAPAPSGDVKVGPMKVLVPGPNPHDAKPSKTTKSIGWTDRNGENTVVFSTQTVKKGDLKSEYLTVEHVVEANGTKRTLRTVRDKEEQCDADVAADFREEPLTVTDLDNDGIGEVTFAYVVSCQSDASPMTLKLLVLENGDKYILRGSTRIDGVGGEYKIDPSFNGGPPAFLEHAKKQWLKARKTSF